MSNKFKELSYQVIENDLGKRIDQILSKLERIGSRSQAAKLIQNQLVTVNGSLIKSSYRAEANDSIIIKIPDLSDQTLQPFDFNLDIIYEDCDLLVVNKPCGLVVHPAHGHEQDTLVNALIHHTDDLSMGFNEKRPGIVHRIDKDTSGLLVVAKNNKTHLALAKQFKEKSVHRTYQALVFGPVKKEEGRIDNYLVRHPKDRKRFAVEHPKEGLSPTGKRAITEYKVLETHHSGVCFVQCQLETGRTHQIRVHLAAQQNAILGDPIYSNLTRLERVKPASLKVAFKEAGRLWLHAAELGFIHPTTNEALSFKQTWDAKSLAVLQILGFNSV